MRLRPVLAVVQRAAAAGGSEGDVAAGGDAPGDLVRAGDGAFVLVDGEVVEGEPALDRRLQRLGLDHRGIPGLPDRVPQVPGAVGGIGVPGQRLPAGLPAGRLRPALAGVLVLAGVLGGEELRRGRRVGVVLAAGPGQLLIGDDPGLRLGRRVRAVAVAAGLAGFAGVPGVRAGGRDHPAPGDLAGDPPLPAGPVAAPGGLHVLPGHQRQRRGGLLLQLRALNTSTSASASLTSAETSASFAAGSSQPIFGLPGLE
jgi:hypothetical protein